jgi:hypothetical protein
MSTRRSRLALIITFTELKAMPASAITGCRNPKIATKMATLTTVSCKRWEGLAQRMLV